MLHRNGLLTLANSEVYGFTHYTSEILQQIRFISGEWVPPSRLRPYMNIPQKWQFKPARPVPDIFASTDIFVVEISSIRVVRFKSVYLQINRVRELLQGPVLDAEKWMRQIMGKPA